MKRLKSYHFYKIGESKWWDNIIHLLTGYEGNSTFIVPKVPTTRKIVGTLGTIKVLLPEYQIYKCFTTLNNCAIQNSKLGPFLMDF